MIRKVHQSTKNEEHADNAKRENLELAKVFALKAPKIVDGSQATYQNTNAAPTIFSSKAVTSL